ncbi:protein SPO16 homolog [Phycodurus eques]|uniref:protein SPO16 homolog n=1 Tax=Phycodurus eques TaxID=693459 RepID=UPI002ACDDD8B|nr:protein SPO16 homolog [Phycodurus eques]
MAADAETRWTTTIIISASLQSHETIRMLRAQQHRIRLSDSVECGAFIFPLSGTAFKLVEPENVQDESVLVEQIQKFVQVHRNSFVLLYAPFNGKRQLDMLSLIQQKFFGTNLRILPVRNNGDVLKGMLTIAKVLVLNPVSFADFCATSKPHVDRIRHRMAVARTRIVERSPVWDMLRKLT